MIQDLSGSWCIRGTDESTGHGFIGSFDAPWFRQILDHCSWPRSPQRNAPLETFGILGKWSPRRGGSNRRFDCRNLIYEFWKSRVSSASWAFCPKNHTISIAGGSTSHLNFHGLHEIAPIATHSPASADWEKTTRLGSGVFLKGPFHFSLEDEVRREAADRVQLHCTGFLNITHKQCIVFWSVTQKPIKSIVGKIKKRLFC